MDTRITKTKREIESLVSTLSNADGNQSVIRHVGARMEELDGELQRLSNLKKQADELQSGSDMGKVQLDLLVHAFASFKESFPRLTIHEKHKFIKLFVKKMEWGGENLHIFIYGK